MTGFARQTGGDGNWSWAWELKSVNGRGLEPRCRVPTGFDRVELGARAALTREFTRGNINASLDAQPARRGASLRVNDELLGQLAALASDLAARTGAAPARIDGLMALRGVIESAELGQDDETAIAARDAAVLATLDVAIAKLKEARAGEGRALGATLVVHVDEIAGLIDRAASFAVATPAAIKTRIEAQLAELLGNQPQIAPERLAQEAAMLALRADVREEIDRLRAHVSEARRLLEEGGAIGRRLDFLSQELNREANTLCSKSADLELTRTGLALKATIDRFREQAANVE
jgi:uncharacterized protein (TIGR00255 family)